MLENYHQKHTEAEWLGWRIYANFPCLELDELIKID
jgi:hypothetical protein